MTAFGVAILSLMASEQGIGACGVHKLASVLTCSFNSRGNGRFPVVAKLYRSSSNCSKPGRIPRSANS